MDQVRKILSWLKQYHFWVLSVLIALVSLFCWWSASGAMSKLFADNLTKISGGFSQVQAVQNDPFHPNDDINLRQKKEITEQLVAVGKVWQQLFDRQSEEVLKWPDELIPQFIETVDKLQFGDEIEDKLREHYQNYIENHFPRLPEKIGARAIEKGQTGAGGFWFHPP